MRKYLILLVAFGLLLGISMYAAAKDKDKPKSAAAKNQAAQNQAAQNQTVPANVTDPDLAANTPEKVHDKLCKAGESAANLFYVIDTQQTGKVTPADLQAFVKKVESADKSNKGYVTADDMVVAANTSARHRMMWKLDNKYDKDNDGTVSVSELGKDANLYKGLDVNKDGVIGNDDFTVIGQRACVATNATRRPAAPIGAVLIPATFEYVPTAGGGGGGAGSGGGGSAGASSGGAASSGATGASSAGSTMGGTTASTPSSTGATTPGTTSGTIGGPTGTVPAPGTMSGTIGGTTGTVPAPGTMSGTIGGTTSGATTPPTAAGTIGGTTSGATTPPTTAGTIGTPAPIGPTAPGTAPIGVNNPFPEGQGAATQPNIPSTAPPIGTNNPLPAGSVGTTTTPGTVTIPGTVTPGTTVPPGMEGTVQQGNAGEAAETPQQQAIEEQQAINQQQMGTAGQAGAVVVTPGTTNITPQTVPGATVTPGTGAIQGGVTEPETFPGDEGQLANPSSTTIFTQPGSGSNSEEEEGATATQTQPGMGF